MYQERLDRISPIVHFVFSHDGHFGLGGYHPSFGVRPGGVSGEGVGGGDCPAKWGGGDQSKANPQSPISGTIFGFLLLRWASRGEESKRLNDPCQLGVRTLGERWSKVLAKWHYPGHQRALWGGGGGWHKASVSICLPLAAPIGLSPPLLILTLCGPERVLVVSTEPRDDLSCLTTVGCRLSRRWGCCPCRCPGASRCTLRVHAGVCRLQN